MYYVLFGGKQLQTLMVVCIIHKNCG